MYRTSVGLLVAMACVGNAFAQQQSPPPSTQQAAPTAWNVTLAANSAATSTLSVVNHCRSRHDFEIRRENVPFLTIPQSRVRVSGGQSVTLPVQFNTQNVAVGTYHGSVLVVCVTCPREVTCKQDREVLDVVLSVPEPSGQPGAKSPTTSTPTGSPTASAPQTGAAYAEFSKGPCPEGANDCDELRKKAAELEAAAAAAKATADAADTAAKDAEATAAAATTAAQPAPSTGGAKIGGEEYSSADMAYLEKLRQENNAALKAKKITPTQHQQRARELTLKKAREERLANEARLKAEAEAARAAAAEAKAKADAAQKAAAAAKAAADEALKAYEKCLKAAADRCEAAAAAAKKKKDDETRAAATRAEEEQRRKDAAEAERSRVAEQKYLLDNIKRLGLISSAPFEDIPGAFDRIIEKIIPDILGKTAEQWVAEMATTAAQEATGTPIPLSSIQAVGGLYQIVAALLDPCTQAGKRKTVERLQGMTNPKTNAKYTLDEALDKTERMCALLTELKAKLEAIKKLQGAKSPQP